eukprot:108243-Chlamydomonas_euryale.AAC.3
MVVMVVVAVGACMRSPWPSPRATHVTPEHHTRASHQSITPERHTRASHQNITPEHHTRASHQGITPEHHTRTSHQSITPEHHTRAFSAASLTLRVTGQLSLRCLQLCASCDGAFVCVLALAGKEFTPEQFGTAATDCTTEMTEEVGAALPAQRPSC